MATKLRNIIYPKPISQDVYFFDDCNNGGKDKDKDKDSKKDKDDKYNPENKKSIITKYVNGGISGMCGVILSHPIDTIKTHIQTGNKLSTFNPSFTNFYKGISAPLLGVGLEKAIVFGTYNYVFSKTDNIPLSGAISGLVASFIVTPYERIKILKQNSQVFTFKDINTKFLFRGLSATFTREAPGFAIYFSTYEYLKKRNFTIHNKNIDYSSSFIYGGISGLSAWLFIYPQDKIKTIMQSETQNNKSIISIINSIYKNGGFSQFYKGFSWAAGRAVLLHSGTFCMMEYLNNNLYQFGSR
jgi:solute carrier family 25 carnitine/acylcarnitine transporter 20/29